MSSRNISGPSSALTSFLRERGIPTSNIPSRFRRRDDIIASREDLVEEDEENLEEIIPVVLSRRRNCRKEEEDGFTNVDESIQSKNCKRCGLPNVEVSFSLCVECISLSTVILKRKKQQQKIRKVQDISLLDALNDSGKVSLLDLCVKSLCENIDKIEEGTFDNKVSEEVKEKISIIMSKHRKINNDTIRLFFGNNFSVIRFYDCANITEDGYREIAFHCSSVPHSHSYLSTLHLTNCGQITDEIMKLFSTYLAPSLKNITLEGAFLVSDSSFSSFLSSCFDLLVLRLRHNPKIGPLTIESLSQQKSLRSLALCNSLNINDHLLNCLSFYNLSLDDLDLSFCSNITDDAFSDKIFFKSLTVEGCQNLTDNFLDKLVGLEGLDISRLSLVSDYGVNNCIMRSKDLKSLNLSKCAQLTDGAFDCISSGYVLRSLIYLNIDGLFSLSERKLIELSVLPNLEEIDFSWCTNLTDVVLESITSLNLRKISIWGCWRVSNICMESVSNSKTCRIIGNDYF